MTELSVAGRRVPEREFDELFAVDTPIVLLQEQNDAAEKRHQDVLDKEQSLALSVMNLM